MKNRLTFLLLTVLLCLSAAACGQAPSLPGEYPMELEFSSGAGAWRTILILNSDGSFTGRYSDSDMGDAAPTYPNGTLYLSTFSGRFELLPADGSGIAALHLTELTCEQEPGTQEIRGGILHVYTGPHGFYNGEELSPDFVLYPPTTPVSAVSDSLLSWWPGRFEPVTPDTLGSYALENPVAGTAFFYLPQTP